ncbi:c-type cytochrome [Bordetella parapertussis]|uniref:Probable cytochrome C n=1 Tax=Bordetella parapertussis (strain Bpp5) TaxID=1208660 RepID=K0MJE1_BORPB|nr:c-type cytochrome [Bordetella parapertussis]CCJ50036.1 probable cytochrome C [Bordetella parapertussis Bpp5]
MYPHRLVRCRWPVLSALAVAALCSPAAHAQAPADAARIASQGADGVAACVTCHGAKGEGNPAAGFPHLAGLGSGYLYEQLTALANGSRANPVMAPIAKGLSDAQRQALAEYYAGLPAPFEADRLAATHLGEPAKADTGAWLAVRGAWDRNVPACNQCHGPGGIGVGTAFPALAGQPAAYIAGQLRAWRQGQRPPGPLALMPAVATRLSDAEIDAVSAYYANLPKQAAAPRPEASK